MVKKDISRKSWDKMSNGRSGDGNTDLCTSNSGKDYRDKEEWLFTDYN